MDLSSRPALPLDPETRARLTTDYRADLLELQTLIDRGLSDWVGTA